MTDLVVGRFDEQAAGHAPRSGAGSGAEVQRLMGGLPLLLVAGQPVPPVAMISRRLQMRVKRALDIVLSVLAIVALAPLLAVVAIAIKLTSSGPVLFRQRRIGLGGQPFEVFKFRTMAAERCDATGAQQTVAGDTRVTSLGRFLRATSIDELPQLFNILLGSMSIVGPRPMVEGQLAAGRVYRELVSYYDYRFAMKPGLTGWAQCHGLRGPTDDADRSIARIDHDCAYIQNFSLWLDLRVIWQTVIREFVTGTGL